MLRVGDARELQAAVLAMKSVDRDLRSRINKATTGMSPVWKSLVEVNATRHLDTRVLVPGTRIAGGNPPTAVAANSRRRLSGGLVPQTHWAAWEFGGNRNKVTTYSRRSPKGSVHKVTRHTARQLPPRAPKGRVVYPAYGEIGPRLVSLWVQLIVKTVYDAVEGK